MANVCFVIHYILLCCFDLELDTVASLPAGNLKSMEYSHVINSLPHLGSDKVSRRFCGY